MAAQNSTKTPGKPFVEGDERINRGGRPKGFASRVRERTGDGEELVAFALAVLRGDVDALVPKAAEDKAVDPQELLQARLACIPGIRERLEAKRWLADRGYGKAIEAERETDLSGLSTDELADTIAANPELMAAIAAASVRLKANAESAGALQ